jgi:hypothetical protein
MKMKKAAAKARYMARIIEAPDHTITLAFKGKDKYSTAPRRKFEIMCSCGDIKPGTWMWSGSTNLDGTIPVRQVSVANGHIITKQSEASAPILSEPILVAKVHKIRVTHEWWIAPHDSDLVKDAAQGNYGGHMWPWVIMKKQSNGWRMYGYERTEQQAIAIVQKYVNSEKWRGNGIEILYTGNPVGIEAPAATVLNSIKALINQSKAIDSDTSPHEIADILQATDEAIHQMGLLTDLQNDLRIRYAEALDLE